MKYLEYIKKQIYLLSNKTNLIRFPIEKRAQEIEREKKFGQHDHYRIYGVDFYNKLQKFDFNITIFDANSFPKKNRKKFILSPPELGKHPMVTNNRRIYHAIKKS